MDLTRRWQEFKLRRAASRQGFKARKVVRPNPFEDVVGRWDLADKRSPGKPGDDSSVSGLMTFEELRQKIDWLNRDVEYRGMDQCAYCRDWMDSADMVHSNSGGDPGIGGIPENPITMAFCSVEHAKLWSRQ